MIRGGILGELLKTQLTTVGSALDVCVYSVGCQLLTISKCLFVRRGPDKMTEVLLVAIMCALQIKFVQQRPNLNAVEVVTWMIK